MIVFLLLFVASKARAEEPINVQVIARDKYGEPTSFGATPVVTLKEPNKKKATAVKLESKWPKKKQKKTIFYFTQRIFSYETRNDGKWLASVPLNSAGKHVLNATIDGKSGMPLLFLRWLAWISKPKLLI